MAKLPWQISQKAPFELNVSAKDIDFGRRADKFNNTEAARYAQALAEYNFRKKMYEARQAEDAKATALQNKADPVLGYSPADVDAIVAHYYKRKPSRDTGEAIDIGEAMMMAPIAGAKGALRGALSVPGFLGDIYNYAHGATSVASGRPENVIMPDDFKYGQEGLANWLSNNVPGLGRDERLQGADFAGEILGSLAPATVARHAAGIAAKPIRAARAQSALQDAPVLQQLQLPQFAEGGSALRAVFGRTDVLPVTHQKALVEAGAATPEEYGWAPAKQKPQGTNYKPGSSAQQDAAAASGMTVEQLRAKQLADFKRLMSQRGTPVKHKAKGGLARLAARLGADAEPARKGVMNVIKEKGGNWLADSVEGSLKTLKKLEAPRYTHINEDGQAVGAAYGRPMTPEELAVGNADQELFTRNRAVNNWINGPLTNYIKRDLATPADPVRLRAERIAEQAAKQKQQGEAQLAKMQAKADALRAAGDARGADYLLRDMRLRADALGMTHENSLAKALHFAPDEETLENINGRLGNSYYGSPKYAREDQSFPGKSPIGKYWDSMADGTIDSANVHSFNTDYSSEMDKPGNAWMRKAPRDTPVYSANTGGADPTYDLGLHHLTDELSNSLAAHGEHAKLKAGNSVDPQLPEHLVLSPEQLSKMGMEQAVNHVANVNEYRANLKRDADTKFGLDHPAVHSVREYPDAGMKWVELRQPEWRAPEGHVYDRGTATYMDPFDEHSQPVKAPQNFGIEELEEQLKYEGDTMKHCVGGYCDDVASGQSRIMSLRDYKGRPHGTIEIQPEDMWHIADRQSPADIARLKEKLGGHPTSASKSDLRSAMVSLGIDPTARQTIQQIKGRSNKALDPSMWPHVQDFLNNPPDGVSWGNVQDLQNAGLRKAGDKYVTDAEYEQLLDTQNAPNINFAKGGSVAELRATIEQLRKKHA